MDNSLDNSLIIYFIVMSVIFGVVIGSFLNVVIYRIPAGRQIVKGHSMCMSCGHNLAAKDLIPILSWVTLKGKCRYCGAPIASRYTKIESFTGLAFLILAIVSPRDTAMVPLYYGIPYVMFCYVYFVCLVLSFAAIISMMMIHYDVNKCYIGFPIVIYLLKLISITFPYLNKTITENQLGIFLNNLFSTFQYVAFAVVLTVLFTLLFHKKYKLTDLYFDLALSAIPSYGLYFRLFDLKAGPVYIQAAATGLVYALLRSILKDKKFDKYVGIIIVSAYLVISLIHKIIAE